LCLVTGATGYLGGRLVPALLAAGYRVRCLARDPDKLTDVPWADQVELVRGDVQDPASMRRACADVDVLHYLVHSLSVDGFAAVDRRAALITAEAARDAGVRRIVYQGGLRPNVPEQELSDHLASRAEVGEIFLRSGVPSAVLQAAVIIGAGSASFEMLRYLTERLPVMVTPSWVRNRVQPIAVRDVLHYLVAAAGLPAEVNRTFDIGGPNVLTYQEMMQRFAEVSGLRRRRMVPVALLTPSLSSHWINLVTPVPKSIGAPLIDSLVHEVVCGERDIDDLVPRPEGGLTDYDTAVREALSTLDRGQTSAAWTPAAAPADPLPSDAAWSGGTVHTDEREYRSAADPERLWAEVGRSLAEQAGRALPGARWRTVAGEPGSSRAETVEGSVPGRAWLDLGLRTPGADGPLLTQKLTFLPRGLAGQAYWLAGKPVRALVASRLAKVVRAAGGGEGAADASSR
jgi:uncharacterized protein YbjT (DUF2867 family)